MGTMARWALREFLNTLEMPMGWGEAKTLGGKTSINATRKKGGRGTAKARSVFFAIENCLQKVPRSDYVASSSQ